MPPGRAWVIGAAPDCDIVVDLPTVSGHHCRLTEADSGFLLEDLQSTNGTYVNGLMILSPVPVRRTDVILLGSKVAMPWPDTPVKKADAIPAREPETAPPDSPGARRIPGWAIAATSGVVLSVLLLVASVFMPGPSNEKRVPTQPDRGAPVQVGESRKAEEKSESRAAVSPETRAQAAARDDSSRSAPIALATPDIETIVKPHESAIVWLGFRLRDYVFVHGSGWLARPEMVVTTASIVTDLEPFTKDGFDVVAWQAGNIIKVTSLKRHPGYDPENPGSATSVHSNVAVAILEETSDAVCPVAEAGELAGLTKGSKLWAVGFESGLAEKEPYDELKVKLFRGKAELLKSEFLASTATRVYALRVPTPKCCEGSPIFNERGHVVGVLALVSGEGRMIPVSQLSVLLPPPGNR